MDPFGGGFPRLFSGSHPNLLKASLFLFVFFRRWRALTIVFPTLTFSLALASPAPILGDVIQVDVKGGKTGSRNSQIYPSGKLKIAGWMVPMFNRK